MRIEPARRFSSTSQFPEDIRRHLEGLPVTAHRDTAADGTSKPASRQRLAVAAAGLVALAIAASLLVALWQARDARRQRDVTQRVNTFLQEMIAPVAPEGNGVEIKTADVLNEASRRAKAELADQPEVMANVLVTLGRTSISLGLYEPAVADLRAAVAASLKANGELHPTTASAMGWMGIALFYQDKIAEGESVSRKAVGLQRRLHPKGNADLGVALNGLGMNLIAKSEAKAAEPLLQEAAELIKKHLGDNHGYYLASLTALGIAREGSGNVEGAEVLYRKAIEVGRGVEPRYRIFLAQALNYLGILLTNKGAYAEAEDMLLRCVGLYREIMGDSNPNLPILETNLATLYFSKGEYARAEASYRKALEILPTFFSREHADAVRARAGLGLTVTRLERAAEGEPYLLEALAIRQRTLRPDSYLIPYTESALGECLAAQKHYADAEPLLFDGYTGLTWKLGEKDSRTEEARQRMVNLYESWGKPDEAARYRQLER
jgi:tetratricopeptide (TPR) repeat protein